MHPSMCTSAFISFFPPRPTAFPHSSRQVPRRLHTHVRRSIRLNPHACTPQSSSPVSTPPAPSTRLQPRRREFAGGKGPLSAEFLSVSGLLATVCTGLFIAPVALGRLGPLLPTGTMTKLACVTMTSFTYGLFLQRFDLRKAANLKLTIVFSILTRFVFIPVLSHLVAIAGYALVRLLASKPAATTAAAAAVHIVNAPATVKATADSLSLPAGVLSSLFLLSTTPPVYSPPIAMLSQHVHTTLLAILVSLTLFLFPVLPMVSHALSLRAHRSALLNIGSLLPQVIPPPAISILAGTTTLPFTLGLLLNRILPPRAAGLAALIALPTAWLLSLAQLLAALHATTTAGVTGLIGSFGLCLGVTLTMLVLGHALARAMLLQRRARRTLLLYLCAQGCVVGAGVSPSGCAAAAHVAAAAVGLVVVAGMAMAWSHVVIRTKSDVI